MMFMNNFMAGFFLVFSFFKLLNLRGFADSCTMLLKSGSGVWYIIYSFI